MTKDERRAKVIANGLVNIEKKVHKALWERHCLEYNQFHPYALRRVYKCEDDLTFEGAIAFLEFNTQTEEDKLDWDEAHRVNDATRKRVYRLHERIEKLLEEPCLFMTLTFDDDALATSEDTRRQYVRRWLSKYGAYVGNKDFGKDNGREHYHAVLQANKVDFKSWTHGTVKVEKIRNPNCKALSKYVAKLTNHAIKETTHGSRIIYSR